MSEVSPAKLELLRQVTERLTGAQERWLGLLDEFGNELTVPGYKRQSLGRNWENSTGNHVSFDDIGPVYVLKTVLYDRPVGGKPIATCKLSDGLIHVPPHCNVNVSQTFPMDLA